jgi:hypothetical protein
VLHIVCPHSAPTDRVKPPAVRRFRRAARQGVLLGGDGSQFALAIGVVSSVIQGVGLTPGI